MKKILSLLFLLLCSACATTRQEAPVPASAQPDALSELAFYAMSLAGTPYQYGGDTPSEGFDCSGFVRHVFRKSLGLQLPHTSAEMSRLGVVVELEQLHPGDLVFYNTSRDDYSHVGIYLGDSRFVHSPSSGKSVEVVNMRESYWKQRYNGARRITAMR